MTEENRYYAAQRVPQTGIYQVIHYQHRLPHKVVMRQGQRFPACNTCRQTCFFQALQHRRTSDL